MTPAPHRAKGSSPRHNAENWPLLGQTGAVTVPTPAEIEAAADVLRAGGLVAFPTETVYGLGADASSPEAVARLYRVKGRPAGHPVIVHLAAADQLARWAAEVSPDAAALAAACWPGPLTLVVRRAPHVPDAVTGGRETVGLRVPDHAVALALLAASGGGIAAPSANRFGRVSPTTAAHVRDDLADDVDVVLDGGPCVIGVESTIVDCSGTEAVLVRLGGVPHARVEEIVGHDVPLAIDGEVAAPGTLASHYAPDATVEIVEADELAGRVRAELDGGARVAALAADIPADVDARVLVLGVPPDADGYAAMLYGRLREADARGVDKVLAVPPTVDGRGAAVVDRLRRAAANRPERGNEQRARRDRPIGVFDSGLGGLTVLRALFDLMPDEEIVYFGDTGRFPYGPKPADEVLKYSLEIADVLLEHDVKALVVACNSAAAAALDELRARLQIPVVGVVEPGLRAALRVTRSGRVGVIGTVGTISSGAYQRGAVEHGTEVALTCAACPGFVEFVEAGDVDSDQVHVLAERLLAPVRAADVDTLVLGCTHYPLLARTIGDVMGRDVVLVSSAEETAFAVQALLADHGIAAPSCRGPGRHTFLTSGEVTTFRDLGARFLGPEVESVRSWQWS